MTPEEWNEVLTARKEVDRWKAQARLYMIELAKVNRACARKVRMIQGLRQEIRWLNKVLNDLEQEGGRK